MSNFNPNYSDPFNEAPSMMTPPVVESTKGRKGKKDKSSKTPTKRVVSTQKKLFFVLALVFALLVVLLLSSSSPVTYVARTSEGVTNLVELSTDQWEVVAIDPELVEPDAFSAGSQDELLEAVTEAISGKRVAYPLGAKQQLRPSQFIDSFDLATPLLPEERLLSVSARASRSIIGSLKPGDRGDVYAILGTGDLPAGLIGSDVEIVAVGVTADQFESAAQEQSDDKDKTLAELIPGEPVPGTYVLRVPVSQIPAYILADSQNAIYLALRGKDAAESEVNAYGLGEAICAEDNLSLACVKWRESIAPQLQATPEGS